MRLHPCKETNVGDQFLQGYRMITGLVARPWFLMEICSKQEIINTVTDPNTETAKIGLFPYFSIHLFGSPWCAYDSVVVDDLRHMHPVDQAAFLFSCSLFFFIWLGTWLFSC